MSKNIDNDEEFPNNVHPNPVNGSECTVNEFHILGMQHKVSQTLGTSINHCTRNTLMPIKNLVLAQC